jgi:hypothetical protein
MKSLERAILKHVAFVGVIIIGLLGLLPVQSHGQEAIPTGLQWLRSVQLPEDFWGKGAEPSIRDTTAAVDTFQIINPSDTAYILAIEWLKASDPVIYDYESLTFITLGPANYDYSARRLYSFSKASQNVTVDLNYLRVGQRVDGGWGLDPNHESDIIDTALVLQAIAMAGGVNDTAINSAVNYLRSAQNPDGGWGFVAGDPSHPYTTALAFKALSGYAGQYALNTPLQNAVNYLLNHQTAPGHWENTVYLTALAYIALHDFIPQEPTATVFLSPLTDS